MKLKEPIEGIPAYTQSTWQTTFYNQRRDRLADVVMEYLTCDATDADQLYRDIVDEIDGWIVYHKQCIDKATKVKTLLMGHADGGI